MTDFTKPLKRPKHLLRRDVHEVPRPDGALDGLKDCVLADALVAAQHERVVDLLVRTLHPVRKPMDDVLGVVGIDFAHVVKPGAGLARVAAFDRRR